MPSLELEHVAVAVVDLDKAVSDLSSLWGLSPTRREVVADQGVEEATIPVGAASLQLIAPTGPDTAIGRFLEQRGEGLHHIAYAVDDLEATLGELKARGVRLIDERPRPGGGGHSIAFVHPESSHGVLVELVEKKR
ncbi:MAG: methylmalonyl-CoA epimerase [Actinobacteria bacterium]|nr:methylmalonyl-CoA epimerase [Actinomycetota bacterium]